MSTPLAQRAGEAVVWKTLQLAGVKAIFLARMLILARLLSPDDFGLLAIAMVGVGVLMSVTELGMTPALVHQTDPEEVHYDSAWTTNVARALLVSLALLLAAPAIAELFAEPRAASVLQVLALKPLIDAGASVKTAALMRLLRYRSLALVAVPAAVVDTVVAIALAPTFGVWALVAGTLAGSLASTCSSYLLAPHRPRLVFSVNAVRPLLRYGQWVFFTRIVSVAATSLTHLVISRRLGVVEVGLYALAARLAFLPHEVAGQVVGDVAFSFYARIRDDRKRVAKGFRSLLLGTSAVLIPVYLLLICVAPALVAGVLGERWSGTEPLIQLLAIVGIVGLFGDTTDPVFRGLGYPNWILWVEVWQSTLIIALLWVLTGWFGVSGAALAWILAIGSSQVVSFLFLRRLVPRPFDGALGPLSAILIAAIGGAAGAVIVVQLMPGVVGLVLALSSGIGLSGALVFFLDRRLGLGLRDDLAHAFPRLAALVTPGGVAR